MSRILGTGAHALPSAQLGFGCMGITAFYGNPIPDEQAIAVMKHAYDNGCTHFDTAEMYTAKAPDGSTIYNETVVGKAIKLMDRSKILVATKYMPQVHGDTMTPEQVLEACRASLRRLQLDYVDLYYVHRFHPKVSAEDQARAMKAVLDAGLAKHIGVSEFSPESIRQFHPICPITCVQQEWSLFNRDLEEQLVPTCRELGIGIVAYSPLSRALLTGTVKSAEDLKEGDLRTSRYPRLSEENIVKNARLVAGLEEIARRKGVSPAQLALAWVLAQGEDVVPIPGTTKISNLDSNIAARNLKLTKQDLEEIERAVPLDQISGDRYHGGDSNTFKGNRSKL